MISITFSSRMQQKSETESAWKRVLRRKLRTKDSDHKKMIVEKSFRLNTTYELQRLGESRDEAIKTFNSGRIFCFFNSEAGTAPILEIQEYCTVILFLASNFGFGIVLTCNVGCRKYSQDINSEHIQMEYYILKYKTYTYTLAPSQSPYNDCNH